MCRQTKLTERAKHTVAFNPTKLALGDFLSAVNHGMIHRNRYNVADFEILCPGNNLNIFVLADIDHADPHMVGIGVTFKAFDSARDNIVKLTTLFFK